MSKQGGYQILPIPPASELPMTWEEYKKKYGVDLDSVFKVIKIGDLYTITQINKKPILLQDSYTLASWPNPFYPNSVYFNQMETKADADLTLAMRYNTDSEIGIIFKGNKTIEYYEI